MIDLIEIHPLSTGTPLEINTLAYPLHQFDPVTDIDEVTAKRLNIEGEWPTFTSFGAMHLVIGGDIVGNLGADYTAKRMAFMEATRSPWGVQTQRKHGFLRLQLTGWTEYADADYVTLGLSAPMTTEYVSVTAFQWTIKLFTPYFIGASTTKYFLS